MPEPDESTNEPTQRAVPDHFDPFLHDAGLRRVYRLLLAGRFEEFESAIMNDVEPWLAHSILTSEEAAIETVVFERLYDEIPTARSLAYLGGARLRDAWQLLDTIEGDVDDFEFARIEAQFLGRMTATESTLQEAIRLGPALADPWVHLLSSGRALGIDLPDLRTRFENAHSREPYRPDACRQYLLGLSSRRGGADGAMFEFARWLEDEAPPDSPARLALPMAHLEHGLSETSDLTLSDHLSLPDTVDELAPALDGYLAATPPEARPSDLIVLNTFALAMTVIDGDTADLVTECFRRIDNRPTTYPWSLYEEERITSVFAEVQRSQVRAAERFP